MPLQGIAPETIRLGWRFFKGLQNENEGNEDKNNNRDLNCTMDKIDKAGENNTQRLYRCCSNCAV